MRFYKSHEWKLYRRKILDADGHRCVHCHREHSDQAILQVHHLKYERGKKPWDYALKDCETVCRGCHAEIHGKIRPTTEWEYFGQDDLGSPEGECELCGTVIRHVFFVGHAKWGIMEVGEICCDKITATKIGTTETKKRRRLERFLTKWQRFLFSNGEVEAEIFRDNKSRLYRLSVCGTVGKLTFASPNDAKMYLFEIINSGDLENYLSKKRTKSRIN